MSSMINIFKKFQNNELLSIYQGDSEKFLYGKIIVFNETEVAIYLISPVGKYDGLVIVKTDSITRIEYGGPYDERMRKLIDDKELNAFNHTLSNNSICEQILGLSARTQSIVSVEILDSGCDDITGIVETIEDDCVCIKIVDVYGNYAGNAWAIIEDITQISFSGGKENAIGHLMKSSH